MQNNIELKNINLSVIGVGLMGGSILKALKDQDNKPKSIKAFDIDKDILNAVLKKELADVATDDAKEAIKDADLIVISLYPKLGAAFIKDNIAAFKPGCVITDICGVKREVYKEIKDALRSDIHFVGGHPMAGREHKGFSYSTPDLFLGCKYILTGGEKHAVDLVCQFADILGAGKIVYAQPEKHDELIAYTSQLPHVLSVAYMLCSKNRNVEDFSAGSFRDITRIAMINDEMWSELFLENKDKLSGEIGDLIHGLSQLKSMIDTDNRSDLRQEMRNAAQMREEING
jgi:prephenate dehydrogenase